MAVDIDVPDFDFTGFYYGEILDALIVYKRQNVPEISNENPFEPGIQLLRAFALVGHLNNTLLDMVANETMLPTSKLRDSVVNLLALIGYVPDANRPSTATLRAGLTKSFDSSTLIVTDNALFGTRRRSDTPPILFESDGAITIDRTDQFSGVYVTPTTSPTWTDITTEMNAGAGTATFLSTANQQLYVAHANVMTDTVEFELAGGVDIGDNQPPLNSVALIWEFNDGSIEDRAPDSVMNAGATLRFYINGLLGTSDLRDGDVAYVTVNQTGVREQAVIFWDPTLGNYIESGGFLGQTFPSLEANDYTVGKYWREITGISDTTEGTFPVVDEPVGTGDTVETSFAIALDRWPLEADTPVVFEYLSGAVTKTATWNTGNELSGDAAVGTTVDTLTGVATLVALSVPDADPITASYTREAQSFQSDGKISFKVPKTSEGDWNVGNLADVLDASFAVAGLPSGSHFWLRCRHVGAGYTPALASGVQFSRMHHDSGGLFISIPVTQGRTFTEVAGVGDGASDQSYALNTTPVIEGSVMVTVDGISWSQVENFASSDVTDLVFTVRVDSDGVATVGFGDGVNGRPPTAGANISAEYRVGGAEDGNVGADQIRVNRTGLSRLRSITNPTTAFGWTEQEGASNETLEKLKRDGVASIRVLERAVTTSDIETLATTWAYPLTDQRPFSRAKAIQNGFGPNTVKLLLVPIGGALPTSAALKSAVNDYYNGNTEEGGDEDGVLLLNNELKSEDVVLIPIDVTATVTGGNREAIEAALGTLIAPEAVFSDGVTFVWDFGGTVGLGKLNAAIFATNDKISDVVFTLPVGDVSLAVNELPTAGTISITIAG